MLKIKGNLYIIKKLTNSPILLYNVPYLHFIQEEFIRGFLTKSICVIPNNSIIVGFLEETTNSIKILYKNKIGWIDKDSIIFEEVV